MIEYSNDNTNWKYASPSDFKDGVHKAAVSLNIKKGEMIYARDTNRVFYLAAPYEGKA